MQIQRKSLIAGQSLKNIRAAFDYIKRISYCDSRYYAKEIRNNDENCPKNQMPFVLK
jgi:hypothetical protein